MTPEELRDRIDTIVIVMMENRSFDHMLGYLRLPAFGGRVDVEGLDNLANPDYGNARQNGIRVQPFIAPDDKAYASDLPHEREFIAEQLAFAPTAGSYLMNGFVSAYERYTATTGGTTPPPMRILTPPFIPVTDFLAQNFLVCDHWHAPLPASTQPNRLMAISGFAMRDHTHGDLLPDKDTLFDWLDRHHVSWRVYSCGLSFLLLMPRLWDSMLTGQFRGFGDLAKDFKSEGPSTFPKVIVVEPEYDDSPIHLGGHPNDNHPPVPVAFGEAFLKSIYEAVTSNPARWAKTLMVLTYDEHGGFFDHVAPEPVPSPAPPGATYPAFPSTGPRVPAILISPYAPRRGVAHDLLDHTSILQLLADRFDSTGTPYSDLVHARRQANASIRSVTEVLSTTARNDIPSSPAPPPLPDMRTRTAVPQRTAGQTSFRGALIAAGNAKGAPLVMKYPQVGRWLAELRARGEA